MCSDHRMINRTSEISSLQPLDRSSTAILYGSALDLLVSRSPQSRGSPGLQPLLPSLHLSLSTCWLPRPSGFSLISSLSLLVSTPSAPYGPTFHPAPPRSSVPLASPQSSGTLTPPRTLVTAAPPPGPSVSPGPICSLSVHRAPPSWLHVHQSSLKCYQPGLHHGSSLRRLAIAVSYCPCCSLVPRLALSFLNSFIRSHLLYVQSGCVVPRSS